MTGKHFVEEFTAPTVRVRFNAALIDSTTLDMPTRMFFDLTNAGKLIARDAARQRGTHAKRHPEIDAWIATAIAHRPHATRETLWRLFAASEPGRLEFVGKDRFFVRVSAVRKAQRVASK